MECKISWKRGLFNRLTKMNKINFKVNALKEAFLEKASAEPFRKAFTEKTKKWS